MFGTVTVQYTVYTGTVPEYLAWILDTADDVTHTGMRVWRTNDRRYDTWTVWVCEILIYTL